MKNIHIKTIFADSQCIDRTRLIRYGKQLLSEQEMFEVEKHLVDCDLCSEALEGLTLMAGTGSLREVDKGIDNMFSKKSWTASERTNRYLLVAASVAILLVSSMVVWMFSSNQPADQLAQQVEMKEQNPAVEPQSAASAAAESREAQVMETVPAKVEEKPVPALADAATKVPQNSIAGVQRNEDQFMAMREPNKTDLVESDESVKEEFATSEAVNNSELLSLSAPQISTDKKSVAGTTSRNVTRKASESEPVFASRNEVPLNVTYVHGLKAIDYAPLFDNAKGNLVAPATHTNATQEVKKDRNEIADSEKPADPAYLQRLSTPLTLVSTGKYKEAAPLLKTMRQQQPLDMNAAFYLGLCYYHLQQHSLSNTEMIAAAAGNQNTFREEAQYYQALNHLALNELPKAEKMLQTIIKQNGFYKTKAEAELKKLK